MLCLLIITLLCVLVSGCGPDLGDFADEDAYRNFFGEFKLYNNSFSPMMLSIDDFYYDDIDEEFKASMEYDTYSYLFIEVDGNMSLQEFYLYFISDEVGVLTIDVAILNFLPTHFRPYDYEEPEPGEEGETHDDDFLVLSSGSVSLSERWNSVGIKFGAGFEVSEGYYIIIRFKNNTVFGRRAGLEKIRFKTTGLFVRALEV